MNLSSGHGIVKQTKLKYHFKMKKLFVLLFLCMYIPAQSQIYMLNAYTVSFYKTSTDTWNSDDCNIKIVYNIEDEIIKIDNKYEDVFCLRNCYESNDSRRDSEGDLYTQYKFMAYDNQGDECEVWVSMWKHYNLVKVTILYTNMVYGYSCRVI